MMERVRCFVAVEIDDTTVLEEILEAQRAIGGVGADLKLVEPENIHITMRFLGAIPTIMVERVSEEMDGVRFAPFDVEFRGLGAFPGLGRMRVLWVGLGRGQAELRDIFGQLEPRLRRLGFPPDRRGFSPHATIARVRSGRNKERLREVLMEMKYRGFGTMRAEALRLKRSVLTPEGPIYSTIHEVRAVEP